MLNTKRSSPSARIGLLCDGVIEDKYSGTSTSTIITSWVPSHSGEPEEVFHGCSVSGVLVASCSHTCQGTHTPREKLEADLHGSRVRKLGNDRWFLSVEKDCGLTGWILPALEWISPGLGPCMAAAHQLWRLVLFIPASHLHWGGATCQWWQTGGSLSSTTWLLWEAKHLKSRKKEQRKKWGTTCAFTVQHPHMLNKPNNNLGTLPGGLARSVQAVEEPVLSVGWNTMGISPGWEAHPGQRWWI